MSKSRVLIVEDELLIRMNAVALIGDAGCEAPQAASADLAIELLETDPRIRVVFTDIDLPGSMNELQRAIAIHDRWPSIELILTSNQFQVSEADLPERSQFLRKPYDASQLGLVLAVFVS